MKGQAQVITSVAAVFFVAIMALVGLVVYGSISDVVPHDRTIINETMCTTCVNGTPYTFVNVPVLNDTDMICYNGSADLMTNGVESTLCLGYNIIDNSILNITNSSPTEGCQTLDVVCTYTFDEANTNEQSFFDANTSTTYSGFTLVAVIAIVLAAVFIMGLVLMMRG